MRRSLVLLASLGVLAAAELRADPPPDVPRTVEALWADVDPRADPLEVKIVREWTKDGVVLRYVTFRIAAFKGKPARMAAFFGFPEGGEDRAGLLHIHGGGQRASLHQVEHSARRGYACLSINWGGNAMEGAEPGDPNTDWGAIDPTMGNARALYNVAPVEGVLDPVESPRNSNWFPLTLAARRGLTFLERQTQVDADRLGVYGHSIGGELTLYVAGTDDRVKVAAPSAGGVGFRTEPWALLPEQPRHWINGDVELFRSALDLEFYAPRVRAPLLWLGATNDFCGLMDDTYRTGALIPHGEVRYAFTPHLNHRFTPEFAVTQLLWIDQHLGDGFELPETPASKLRLDTDDHVPALEVTPDRFDEVERVHILYSIDPEPRARFWRTAEATREGDRPDRWRAPLPILSTDQPLFAFANVHYRLGEPRAALFTAPTSTYAISSVLRTAAPRELAHAKVKAADTPSGSLIEDFAHGWRDWYRLFPANPHHWQLWTRKITDPKWRGPKGAELTFEVTSEKPNELVVIVTENFFRSCRGKQRDLVAVVPLTGGEPETISLTQADFQPVVGDAPLESWDEVDELGFRAYYGQPPKVKYGSLGWKGGPPALAEIRWVASERK